MAIHVTPIPLLTMPHSSLSGVTAAQHHDKYTNSEALAAAIAGLGSAAVLDAGVGNLNLPQMDSTGYPAADGSAITNTAEQSTLIQFTRTSGAGSGTQVISGVGFHPLSVEILAVKDGSQLASIGYSDDADAEAGIRRDQASAVWSSMGGDLVGLNDGTDSMTAVLASKASGQFTITWTKGGSGFTATCKAICRR